MSTGAFHHDAQLREHRRRFRIDGKNSMQALARALAALETNEEALLLALQACRCETPEKSAREVLTAVRLLVEGEGGKFR